MSLKIEDKSLLLFGGVIFIILIIIVIITQMRGMQEAFSNYKCLQNGYKLAFPDKINSAGILEQKHPFMSYAGIEDGRLTPMTLDNNTRTMLNHILGQILNQINEKTNARYFLRKIDSVNITREKQGAVSGAEVERETAKRCTVDFFAHELKKQETRRFIVIFTIDIDRNIKVEHINLSNAYKVDYGNIGCNENKPNGDNLIHTDEALLTNNINGVCGIDETKMDYSNLTESEKLTNKNLGFANPSEVGKLLFLPSAVNDTAMLNSQGLFPNRKHNGWWDANGVALVEDAKCSGDIIKTGLDHAIGTRPYQPYDNPTVARYEGEAYKNKHHSVFDLARGNFLGRNLSI